MPSQSHYSAATSSSGSTPAAMLDKYLAEPPTIAGRIASGKKTEGKAKKTKTYLAGWQDSWDKLGSPRK
ncbi:hypothetical protein GCG54_00013832 [Colletotrichum gloeosporioides]|uniref:Uncharacterized protein n=1 Tax=Colletotrichum gloeosporioides TaxID=474922 RepID=A0A8H4FQG1_COLGL|nr:uncharacterized protein GCG54_00013832 [Colletotrichum gloeosporioides]KAF3810591.1 hypothetical protein GCG54_00013832 [Colletotrichum gloeosporioides]